MRRLFTNMKTIIYQILVHAMIVVKIHYCDHLTFFITRYIYFILCFLSILSR